MLNTETKNLLKEFCKKSTLEGLKNSLDDIRIKELEDVYNYINTEHEIRKNVLENKLKKCSYIKNNEYDVHKIVLTLCKRCNRDKYHQIIEPMPNAQEILKTNEHNKYKARCLDCGNETSASYNYVCP